MEGVRGGRDGGSERREGWREARGWRIGRE